MREFLRFLRMHTTKMQTTSHDNLVVNNAHVTWLRCYVRASGLLRSAWLSLIFCSFTLSFVLFSVFLLFLQLPKFKWRAMEMERCNFFSSSSWLWSFFALSFGHRKFCRARARNYLPEAAGPKTKTKTKQQQLQSTITIIQVVARNSKIARFVVVCSSSSTGDDIWTVGMTADCVCVFFSKKRAKIYILSLIKWLRVEKKENFCFRTSATSEQRQKRRTQTQKTISRNQFTGGEETRARAGSGRLNSLALIVCHVCAIILTMTNQLDLNCAHALASLQLFAPRESTRQLRNTRARRWRNCPAVSKSFFFVVRGQVAKFFFVCDRSTNLEADHLIDCVCVCVTQYACVLRNTIQPFHWKPMQ